MSIVIVGAGLAGGTAATELREQGYDGQVVLVGAEDHPPYERPPLSKGYLLGNDPLDDAFVHPRDWYAEHDVDLRLGVEATALDTDAHVVSTTGGRPHLRDAPARDRRGAPPARDGRGERRAHGVPAHDRGQQPAQGGVQRGRPHQRSSAPAGSGSRSPRRLAKPVAR